MKAISPEKIECGEFLQDLIDVTMNLPEAKRIEALEDCIAAALNLMGRSMIHRMSAEVDAALCHSSEHQPILDLIEGHLALRDIAQQPAVLADCDSTH